MKVGSDVAVLIIILQAGESSLIYNRFKFKEKDWDVQKLTFYWCGVT